MSITRYFDLYLTAGKTIPLVINANQYDESEQWVFTLYSDTGVKYTPSSGSIVGIKSDGYLIANAGTVDEQGRVVITETQQMTAAAGKAIFELQIDNDTHGTANFIVLVEPSPTNGGTASTSDISLMQEAITAAGEIEEIMGGQTVTDVIAPVISDWLEENMTNPSNPAIDASLTVSGAAADAKVTGDEITDLKNALDEVAEEQTTTYSLVWITGAYLNAGTPETYSGWRYTDYVAIGDAETIDFTTDSTSGAAIYNDWYNSSKQYISSFSTYGTHLTPPSGAKYFRLSCRTTETNTASYTKTVIIGLNDKLEETSQTIVDIESAINSVLYISPNIFDKNTITEGYYVLKNGTVTSGYADSFVSTPIKIKKNTNYKVGKKTIRIRVQNADGDLLTVFHEDNLPSDGVFSYSADAYVILSDLTANAKNLMLCKESDYPSLYAPYGETLKISVNDSEIRQSPLNGKKVTWYGDSLMQNNWKDTVSLAFSMDATNCGVGGTKISNPTEADAASMCEATRINGEYPAYTDPNTGVVTQPVAIPDDAEIIIIGGGTNDWAQNVPLGNMQVQFSGSTIVEDVTTFYQACHCMFRRLSEERPDAKIIVLGTPFALYENRWSNTYGLLNNLGLSALDYGKALCDVARMWGYFALDYGEYMGINESNVATLLNPDSDGHLHPSIDTSKQMFARCTTQRLLTIKYLY